MKGSKLGMTRAIVSGSIAALGCMAAFQACAEVTAHQLKRIYGSDLEVLGEVQQIDLAHNLLIVAGQHIVIAKETSLSYDGVAVEDSSQALRMIQLGDMLAISGAVGSPAISINRLKDAYVAGASTIYVKGKVASVDSSVGFAKIDEMPIDLTPAMSDSKAGTLEL